MYRCSSEVNELSFTSGLLVAVCAGYPFVFLHIIKLLSKCYICSFTSKYYVIKHLNRQGI